MVYEVGARRRGSEGYLERGGVCKGEAGQRVEATAASMECPRVKPMDFGWAHSMVAWMECPKGQTKDICSACRTACQRVETTAASMELPSVNPMDSGWAHALVAWMDCP